MDKIYVWPMQLKGIYVSIYEHLWDLREHFEWKCFSENSTSEIKHSDSLNVLLIQILL